MALTKQDLREIKQIVVEVVDGRAEVTLDAIDGQFKQVKKEIEDFAASAQRQFIAILADTATIKQDVAELKEDVVVIKDIVKDHSFRIARLEHKTAQL
ncbi:hypothetical protein KY386_00030 [Candidatus Parcubacteria bacterium]|nr:hypothetical protein [Candidatus Parcubacteria bacterium]